MRPGLSVLVCLVVPSYPGVDLLEADLTEADDAGVLE